MLFGGFALLAASNNGDACAKKLLNAKFDCRSVKEPFAAGRFSRCVVRVDRLADRCFLLCRADEWAEVIK